MENKNNKLNNTCTTLPYIWVPTNDAITRDTFNYWVHKHLSQPLNTAAGHQSHDCLVLLFQRIVWRLQLYLLTQIYMNKDVKSKNLISTRRIPTRTNLQIMYTNRECWVVQEKGYGTGSLTDCLMYTTTPPPYQKR